MHVLEIDHVNISGSPALIADCRGFYVDILGLSDGHRPPFRSRGHWLYGGDRPIVHLTERANASSGSTGSFDHFALRCQGREELLARLAQHEIVFEIRGVPDSGGLQVFLKDPAGVQLEINFAAD